MPTAKLFPTYLHRALIGSRGAKRLNKQIQKECYVFRDLDDAGRRWSCENYWGGYTSYGSITDLPFRSSTFHSLKEMLDREVFRFVRHLDWDLSKGQPEMCSCWINIMGPGSHHSFHLHPDSVISGTYYVKVPPNSGAFKVEDPRIACFMGSPPVKRNVRRDNSRYMSLAPRARELVLFESWLKHEVPAHHAKSDRISVSFNYHWVDVGR